MTKQEQKIEDYLETVCFEANPSVLDDDMPDFFDTWLGNQDVEDMIRHCNNFLTTSIQQAVAEERARMRENLPKIITPTVEPPPNNLSQNQIFASGQMNMLLRVTDLLSSLDKLQVDKE